MAEPDPVPELSHPSIREAGAQARERWRAEEEEWTRAAAERWRHGRTLFEVLHELASRGDRVLAVTGPERLTGRLTALGADVAVLATSDGPVDVVLGGPVLLRVAERARAGGRRPRATTLRARLLAREASGEPVAVGAGPEVLSGRLSVGADHVVVEHGGQVTVVALTTLAWVRPDPAP